MNPSVYFQESVKRREAGRNAFSFGKYFGGERKFHWDESVTGIGHLLDLDEREQTPGLIAGWVQVENEAELARQ